MRLCVCVCVRVCASICAGGWEGGQREVGAGEGGGRKEGVLWVCVFVGERGKVSIFVHANACVYVRCMYVVLFF